MSKRPRRRTVKRSGKGHERQRRQRLTKEVQELYPAGAAADDDAWHASLAEEPGPRRGRKRPDRAGAAASADPADPAAKDPAPDGAGAGEELTGRVVAIASGACSVESDGESYDCVLPSELARDQRVAVAVGDRAVFAADADGNRRLRRVLPRRTVLSRPDPHNPRLERVIAANVDVVVHVASVVEPPLRPGLIDRYLIAIDRGGAEAAICVNKIDLLPDAGERRRELERLDPYRPLVRAVVATSAVTGEGLDALGALLAGKTAAVVGHSGVGKSSLLNALDPDLDAATGATAAGQGRHTTTRSSLYRLRGDVRVIDTPGIRELGLWRLSAEELRAYLPDFEPHAARCRFNDCKHSHEPDCGVRAAVASGEISAARFDTYQRILESLEA